MESKEDSSEKSEKYENDPNVAPQQRPMQVGSNVERSYSADELAEPMKAYPRTSERANEGQELTVRKRLMLTETEESTNDETRQEVSQAQGTPQVTETITVSQTIEEPKVSTSQVSATKSQTPSPSPVLIENRLGQDVGDNQDYSAVSDSRNQLEDPSGGEAGPSGVGKDGGSGSQGGRTGSALVGEEMEGPSGSEIAPAETEVEGGSRSGDYSGESEDDADPSKSSFVDITKENSGNLLLEQDRNLKGSVDTYGPTEESKGESSHHDLILPSGQSAQNSNQDSDVVPNNVERGISRDGTHGGSAAQPGPEDFNDAGRTQTATVATPSGQQPPDSVRASQPMPGLKTLHPIENSRQKWELTGCPDEVDIELEEERAEQVAIAPMRLSMTNESEVEVHSLEIDPITGNQDEKMGLVKSENPDVEDVRSNKSLKHPNDVIIRQRDSPLMGPPEEAQENDASRTQMEVSQTPAGNPNEVSGQDEDPSRTQNEENVERSGLAAHVTGEETLIESAHSEDPEMDNLSGGGEGAGRTFHMEGDGTSVDTNDSGPRPEYACNIEDSRPPWVIEAHTTLPSSKTNKTPRIIKSYDEEVMAGEHANKDEEVLEGVSKDGPDEDLRAGTQPFPEEREGVTPDDENQDKDQTGLTADDQAIQDGQDPRLFQRNLQEMSELMNSVDYSKGTAPSVGDTLSAETFEEKEEVAAEDQNVRMMTPPPEAEEPEERTKDLQSEHDLARSENVSQPEQHANRRLVAKPMETACDSCDFVNSDMGSQNSAASSTGSKKYSYAKSKSRTSMEPTFTEEERAISPQERGNDIGVQVPSPAQSQIDIITTESAAASETVPAENEGDIGFYPSKSEAEPSFHNRSIDGNDSNLLHSQPTQLQCTMQCFDDDESSEEPAGMVQQIDDSRNNLWIIQPKEHKRKSNRTAEEQVEHEENYDDYEPEQPPDPKKHRPSDIDSGLGSRRPGRGGRRNHSFQSSQGSSTLPRGRNHGNDSYGEPEDYEDDIQVESSENSVDLDEQDVRIGSTKGTQVSLGNLSVKSSVDADSVDQTPYYSAAQSGPVPIDYVDTSDTKKESYPSLLTPINEERTISQNNGADVSGASSFHSCEENMTPTAESPGKEDNDYYTSESSIVPVEQQALHSVSATDFNSMDTNAGTDQNISKDLEKEATPVNLSAIHSLPVEEPPASSLRNTDSVLEQASENLQGPANKSPSENEGKIVEDIQGNPSSLATTETVRETGELGSIAGKTSTVEANLDYALQSKISEDLKNPEMETKIEPGTLDSSVMVVPHTNSDYNDSVGQQTAPMSNLTRQVVAEEGMLSGEGFVNTSALAMDEPDFRHAKVGISSDHTVERFHVDVPKSSKTEKCIILRQKIKPVELNESSESMTPNFGPSETPSVQVHEADRSGGLINATTLNIVDVNNNQAIEALDNPSDQSVRVVNSGINGHVNDAGLCTADVSENFSQHVSMDCLFSENCAQQGFPDVHQGPIGADAAPEVHHRKSSVQSLKNLFDSRCENVYENVDRSSKHSFGGVHSLASQGGSNPTVRPKTSVSSTAARSHSYVATPSVNQTAPMTGGSSMGSSTGMQRTHAHFDDHSGLSHPSGGMSRRYTGRDSGSYSIFLYDDPSDRMNHKKTSGGSVHSLGEATGRSADNVGAISHASSMARLNRKSTASLTDGISFGSQSVRGSQFAIDMRPDSTPSLNVALPLDRSLANDASLASVPVTPNPAVRSQVGGVAMRSSSFKFKSDTSRNGSSRDLHSVNAKAPNRSVVYTPKTTDLELVSPRDLSQRHLMSSQSLERQLRVTRFRAGSRSGTAGDEASSRRTGGASRGNSKTRDGKKGGSKTASLEQEAHVAAGDEKPCGVKETKSNEHEIVAQVGYGYVTQKDIPMMGPL